MINIKVFLIGGFIGTSIMTFAPNFTKRHFLTGHRFNLWGILFYSFVHVNWAHFISNIILATPPLFFLKINFPETEYLFLGLSIAFMVISGIISTIIGRAGCGYSGVSFMVLGFASVIGIVAPGRWFWRIIVAMTIIAAICDIFETSPRCSHGFHWGGLITGLICGGFGLLAL